MSRLQQDHLEIPQGTTWAVRFPLSDIETGGPVITTGWTVRSQVRKGYHDETVLHEWSTALGNATVFESFVELRVDPQTSSAWKWGSGRVVYDIEVSLPTGEIIRIAEGTISVSREVTR